MPHIFTERSIAVLNHCALTQHFSTHRWMVGMQARLPNCTCLKSRLTSHSPRIWAYGCVWIIIFFPQKCKFSNQVAETRFRLQHITMGDHWEFDVSIFLKIDRFEGAKPHSPLNLTIILLTKLKKLAKTKWVRHVEIFITKQKYKTMYEYWSRYLHIWC